MTSPQSTEFDAAALSWADDLTAEVGKVIVGQDRLIQRILIALLTGGHVLLEGLPGLAKTLVVRTFAQACDLQFRRIQFTPDLLPADLVGTLIYNPKAMEFVVHRGPIFANIVLADEINRAPAKVQSALLEAMQEQTVTIGHETHALARPFFVLATQNPVEHEGTFPLPEAQRDRFLLHVQVVYPERADELEVLRRHLVGATPGVGRVLSSDRLLEAQSVVRQVFVDQAILNYVLNLVEATRNPVAFRLPALGPLIRFGASPRAAVHFVLAARAHALLAHRAFVLPEDVQAIASDVLRHRLILSYEAESDGVSPDHLIGQILATVPVP